MRFKRTFLTVGLVTTVLRVGMFWLLFAKEYAHQSSYADILLVVCLLPEGAFVPKDIHWTATSGLVFSVFLALGSFLFGLMMAALLWLFRRT